MIEATAHEGQIAIIGLGYVGLPLAMLFARHYPTLGYDHSVQRIEELICGQDRTGEIAPEELHDALQGRLHLTANSADLASSQVYIIAVPTPVDRSNRPDLTALCQACRVIGSHLKPGDLAVFESTVYPGVTEEVCVPILEKISGLTLNKDFEVGYSPERINPGDRTHPVESIVKVTSGSSLRAAKRVDLLYRSVLEADTHLAPSIKVAEAAKIIENAQRDVNIAFMNELAKIFAKLNIDTKAVLEAAQTKWNFLPFSPGLVGGHCIGVDPYYLIEKSQLHHYTPRILAEARLLNDSMGHFVAHEVIARLAKSGILPAKAHILQLGITFKEDCPDSRNSKAVDLYRTLQEYCPRTTLCDPIADEEEIARRYGLSFVRNIPDGVAYDAIVLAVAHSSFKKLNLMALLTPDRASFIYDVKQVLERSDKVCGL